MRRTRPTSWRAWTVDWPGYRSPFKPANWAASIPWPPSRTRVDADVGTAVTWAAVNAIRDWGCGAAVLQSSVMGYPVYRAMGFEEVVRYVRFTPANNQPRTVP